MIQDGCDCPEARLLRAVLAALEAPGPNAAGVALERLADAIAVQRLRELSHALASGGNWSATRGAYAHRDQYDTPPRTPEQIRSEVRRSWRESL